GRNVDRNFMKKSYLKTMTLFFGLSLIALLGLIISSIVLINHNGMNQRLQGWVNLLWLPLPIFILIIDRICVRKFELKKVNKTQFYILGILILIIAINWIRLQLQS
ncbi:MAG: hypothetical protein ABI554_00665, partial [Flavobacterium sp.]